ncbi:MAG: hypothetical protein AB1414_04560 [bacterium]
MKYRIRILLLLGLSLGTMLVWGFSDPNTVNISTKFIPKWQVGDWWEVQVIKELPVLYGDKRGIEITRIVSLFKFEVIKIENIDKQPHYIIKVTDSTGNEWIDEYYILKIEKANFILKSLINIHVQKNERISLCQYDNDLGPIVFSQTVGNSIPFDFPIFIPIRILKKNINEVLTIKEEKSFRKEGLPEIKQRIEFKQSLHHEKLHRNLEVVLTTIENDIELKCIQKWEPGKPWWTEAKRVKGDEILSEAELIDYGHKGEKKER